MLPVGSTEQHGYLSLETDNILAERVSAEAAEPLGVLVLPVLAYGLTPSFAAYPGSPTLRLETFLAVHARPARLTPRPGLPALPAGERPRREHRGASLVREWAAAHPDAQAIFHNWWASERVQAEAMSIDPEPSHANWFENFPWTRLEGVDLPSERKPPLDQEAYRVANPDGVRELLGDGVFAGAYQLPDEQVEAVWRAGVEEVRELLESAWR